MKCFDFHVETHSGVNYEEKLTSTTNIATSVINGISSPLAVFTNTLVILAIIRKPSLHTPFNILLSSMAFTDLLVGLVLQPATIVVRLHNQASSFCPIKITVSLVEYFLTCVFFTSLSIISVDRYLILFYALHYNNIVTKRRWITVVAFIWLSWTVLVNFRLFGLPKVFWMSLYVIWAIGILVTLTVCIKIIFLVRRHQREIVAQHSRVQNLQIRNHQNDESVSEITESHSENTVHRRKQAKAAITVVYIVIVFLACYIPIGIVYIYTKSFSETLQSKAAEHWCEAFFYLSSALNPIIYLLRSSEMRAAVKQVLKLK